MEQSMAALSIGAWGPMVAPCRLDHTRVIKPGRRALLAGLLASPALPAWGQELDAEGWTPLYLVGANMTVYCQVNGERVTAVLDSGATNTLMDADLARRLGLSLHGEVRMDAWGATVKGHRATPVTLTVGSVSQTVAPVVMDYGDGRATAERPPELVLGWELFLAWIIDFDFPQGRVRLLPRDRDPGLASPPIAVEVTVQRTANLPVIVEGHRTSAMIDLGSSGGLSVNPAFAQSSGLLEGRPVSDGISIGLGGVQSHQVASVRDLLLAGVVMHGVPVNVVKALKAPWPILGLEIFSRFRMVCDFGGSRLWLEADAAELARPFAKDRTGLVFRPDANGLHVIHVALGSPAAKAGFHVGDRVVTINGRPPGRITGLGGRLGQTYSLRLGAGQIRQVTLAEYY